MTVEHSVVDSPKTVQSLVMCCSVRVLQNRPRRRMVDRKRRRSWHCWSSLRQALVHMQMSKWMAL